MNEITLNLAAQHYGLKTSQLEPLPGGHANHVYGFTRESTAYVLRITLPTDEIDIQAARSILDWMSYLSADGASITKPVTSGKGKLNVEINF